MNIGSASGFWTMARYEIPVLTIVSNNHSYDSLHKSFVAYNGRMKAANWFTSIILDNPLMPTNNSNAKEC
jgi:thiamine pyrophosphate-dependent acetolactate synthase large subunit-like protein